ncbi:MAG: SOS response-associated peptidase [Lachnospiraceae bacterium]|nr:SOS response-associated peptidase [Lachnospiraceae bacterium]
MCGRYYLEKTTETIPYIEKMQKSSLVRKWNDTDPVKTYGEINPADVVPVIAPNRSGKQSVFPMKWGYQGRQRLFINARVETASEKPTFKNDWKSHRCIVPASYYYEWSHITGSNGKTITGDKYSIQPKGLSVTWLCGLYRLENNMPVFVILTREAADNIQFIHNRMPLIMPEHLIDEWIRPESDPDKLVNMALSDMIAEKVMN